MLVSGFTDQVAAAIRLLQECDKAAPQEVQPEPVLERLARVEAALARLQAQLDGLQKGK